MAPGLPYKPKKIPTDSCGDFAIKSVSI